MSMRNSATTSITLDSAAEDEDMSILADPAVLGGLIGGILAFLLLVAIAIVVGVVISKRRAAAAATPTTTDDVQLTSTNSSSVTSNYGSIQSALPASASYGESKFADLD